MEQDREARVRAPVRAKEGAVEGKDEVTAPEAEKEEDPEDQTEAVRSAPPHRTELCCCIDSYLEGFERHTGYIG